jgi:hypothetical protein
MRTVCPKLSRWDDEVEEFEPLIGCQANNHCARSVRYGGIEHRGWGNSHTITEAAAVEPIRAGRGIQSEHVFPRFLGVEHEVSFRVGLGSHKGRVVRTNKNECHVCGRCAVGAPHMPADLGMGRPVERYVAACPTSEVDVGIVGMVGPDWLRGDFVFTGRQRREFIASIRIRDTEGPSAVRLARSL